MSEDADVRLLKIKLCVICGETSIFIDAAILANGDLELSGQDIGKAPSEHFGDSNYEYWLTIPNSSKDLLLLALLGCLYGGDPSAVGKLTEVSASKGIPYKFHSF